MNALWSALSSTESVTQRRALSAVTSHSIRAYLTIIHRSGGKYPPLSPTLDEIIVSVYITQAE